MGMTRRDVAVLGAAGGGTLAAHSLLTRLVTLRTRRQVAALNRGDLAPLLAAYADDAVLHFHSGDHRWAGTHRGRQAIQRFLEQFIDAGLQGDVIELWLSGSWRRMTAIVRFDDRATSPHGEELYANRTVLLLRMRWGRVVHQEDFYEDTQRIEQLDRSLRETENRPDPPEERTPPRPRE